MPKKGRSSRCTKWKEKMVDKPTRKHAKPSFQRFRIAVEKERYTKSMSKRKFVFEREEDVAGMSTDDKQAIQNVDPVLGIVNIFMKAGQVNMYLLMNDDPMNMEHPDEQCLAIC
ncbi:hypothetical protein Fot_24547 [Forsythia ovata]|uniref:Ribosomal protein L32 n=1 Tax=Forsythia ovata TaxID=205694 RepID=A0ABD1U6I5_9LAMI